MKFHNKKITIDGITFASQAEGRRYSELKSMKESRLIKDFEIQPRYPLQKPFRKCPKCHNNQEHIPGTTRKAVTMCRLCGEKTEVIQGIEYVADYRVILLDGSEKIEDVKGTKGYMDPVFKLKRKVFNLVYPDKGIEIVIMPPHKRGK